MTAMKSDLLVLILVGAVVVVVVVFVLIDSECRWSPNSGLLRLRICYGCYGLGYAAIIIIIITIIIIIMVTSDHSLPDRFPSAALVSNA